MSGWIARGYREGRRSRVYRGMQNESAIRRGSPWHDGHHVFDGKMSYNGRRIAFVIAVLFAFALPKRVECGYPGARSCQTQGKWREMCTAYEMEPLAFYLLELVFDRDIGFAYSSGQDCR